jgi:hypothetical protein
MLRHKVVSAGIHMWADGFVYLDDVLHGVRIGRGDLWILARQFRESFMNTEIDDSGVRFNWRVERNGAFHYAVIKRAAATSRAQLRSTVLVFVRRGGWNLASTYGWKLGCHRKLIARLFQKCIALGTRQTILCGGTNASMAPINSQYRVFLNRD